MTKSKIVHPCLTDGRSPLNSERPVVFNGALPRTGSLIGLGIASQVSSGQACYNYSRKRTRGRAAQ